MTVSTRLLNQLQMGDTGTVLQITVRDADGAALDLSDATAITLILESPTGDAKELDQVAWDGDYDGEDGVVKFATEADTFDEAGRWKLQVLVEEDAWSGHTEIGEVMVNANLERPESIGPSPRPQLLAA